MRDIHKMVVAKLTTASENDNRVQKIFKKLDAIEETVDKLKKERNDLLKALIDLEDACTSSPASTIHDAPCRVKARELIAKMKG